MVLRTTLIGAAIAGCAALALAQEPPPAPTPAPSDIQSPEARAEAVAAIVGPDAIPLTLAEVLNRVVEGNLGIRIRRLDPEQAEQDVIFARAEFDPAAFASVNRSKEELEPANSLSASATQFDQYVAGVRTLFPWGGNADLRLQTNRSDITQPFQVFNPGYGSGISLAFTQPLLRGFGKDSNALNIEIARGNLEISQADFERSVMTTIRNATGAYWNLKAAINALMVAQSSLGLANDLLRLNKAKVEVGTLAPIEVTQAEAGVASREEALLVAEEEIRRSEDALRKLMNVEKGSDLWTHPLNPVDDPQSDPVSLELEQEVTTALEKRPEIRSQEESVRILGLTADADRDGLLPQLDLVGNYGFSGTSGRRRFVKIDTNGDGAVDCDTSDPNCVGVPIDSDGDGVDDVNFVPEDAGDAWDEVWNGQFPAWSAGLTFSIPLGNRAARARAARSRIGYEQGQLGMEDLRQTIEIEVRDAVRSVETNIKRVQAARVNADLQARKVSDEQKRYEYGLSTSFQVLTFQNDLTDARNALIRALLDYNRSLVALSEATGVLLEEKGIKVTS